MTSHRKLITGHRQLITGHRQLITGHPLGMGVGTEVCVE